MKLTLNHVAATCVAAATAVACTALVTNAEGEQLAMASGLALLLVSTAGTIAGRSFTKGK